MTTYEYLEECRSIALAHATGTDHAARLNGAFSMIFRAYDAGDLDPITAFLAGYDCGLNRAAKALEEVCK